MSSFFRAMILAGALAALVCRCGVTGRESVSVLAQPVTFASPGSESTAIGDAAGFLWAELIPHHNQMDADVTAYPPGETVLMVSVEDLPQRATEFVVTVEESSAPSGFRAEWHRVEATLQQPDFPRLPPCPPVTVTSEDGRGIRLSTDTEREVWFLPTPQKSRSPGLDRELVTTSSVLNYGRVRIVLDEKLRCDSDRRQWCQQIAARLNNVLIPRVESVFGPVADRLAAGILTVVVTPQVSRSGSDNSPVRAFVLSTDFRVDLDRPEGHACDAIYIAPDLSLEQSDAILVHELTHAAQFCAFRRQFGAAPWPLQDWVIEGTAHASEVLLTHDDSNVAERLQAFSQCPERSPLVVRDAARSGRWRDARCRGAACSFFTWAAQNYGLEAIANLTESSVGDADPWMSAVGQSWRETQRAWLISLVMTDEIHCHTLAVTKPVTIQVDGGATAFFTLPTSAGADHPLRLHIESDRSVPWRATLVRKPTMSSRSAYSARTALASPVTTFR